jgi:putative Ca2+/H+ antiporter (TMEM165/GDT1 family)
MALFVSTFTLIFLAELPDKTAIATLLLAARGRAGAVFTGVAAAFAIQSLIAVTCGQVIGLLPTQWVHRGSGLLFLAFAAAYWHRAATAGKDEKPDTGHASKKSFPKTAWNAFVVIFIAEWGDLTQLATASLVARTREPLTIFLAATAALWAVTGLIVVLGARLKKAVKPRLLGAIAAGAFGLVGLYLIAESFN